MTYILIILSVHYGNSSSIEFNNKLACELALHKIKLEIYMETTLALVCTPKYHK